MSEIYYPNDNPSDGMPAIKYLKPNKMSSTFKHPTDCTISALEYFDYCKNKKMKKKKKKKYGNR